MSAIQPVRAHHLTCYLYSEPILLVDDDDRIIAVLAGRPIGDGTWEGVVREFDATMKVAHNELRFGKRCDRRGNFRTIATGVSYGGGQTVRLTSALQPHLSLSTYFQRPGTLQHPARNAEIMKRLMANRAVTRVANFANSTSYKLLNDIC